MDGHDTTTTMNNHATITSQTSMLASSGPHGPRFPIAGKQLSLRLRKNQIDKAHKDKGQKTFPENFSVTLFLVKPPEDQSDDLIDWSLYGQQQGMWSSNAMNSCSTITATGKKTFNLKVNLIRRIKKRNENSRHQIETFGIIVANLVISSVAVQCIMTS